MGSSAMKQIALFFVFFLVAGAVYATTIDPSFVFVVAFISVFVFAYYAVNYPDEPTEYEDR